MNKWIFQSNIPRKGPTVHKVYYPKTPEDIEAIVKKNGPFLGFGGGHSHSRIDETRRATNFISSRRIKHIYKVTPETLDTETRLKRRLADIVDPVIFPRENYPFKDYFINVGSGVTLNELSEYLKTQGLALPVSSSFGNETLGGCSQTGTHGSGLYLGCIADYIVSIRIVTPDGVFATIEPHRKVSTGEVCNVNEFFHSVCCGVGGLGFVYDMVILVQDAVQYKESFNTTSWLAFRGDLDEFVEDVRELELLIDPYSNNVKVTQRGPFLKPFDYEKKKDVKDASGLFLSTESAVPIKDMDDIKVLVNACMFYITQKKIQCYPLHVRFGATSKHYLAATNYDEDVIGFVYIKMSMAMEKNADRNLRDLTNFETFVASYEGQQNMAYIQGAISERTGVRKWGEVYDLFENNPFKSDFADELAC